MTNNRNRISIAILGFVIFVIPLIFSCYSLNKEYNYTKDRIEEDLKENLLNYAKELEEKLDCYNYIRHEIDKIHFNLFPKCSQEILDKILDDSFAKNLYTKELLYKIISLTKDKYAPIMVTLGTQDFNNLYAYLSPQLEKNINNYKYIENGKELTLEEKKNKLLYGKSHFDMANIKSKYFYSFNKELPPNKVYLFSQLLNYSNSINKGYNYYLEPCYIFISRLNDYSIENKPLFTDYYSKQYIYPITKYTLTSKGIHGFYTLLIPQSHIDPDLLFEYAITTNSYNKVKIRLDNKTGKSEIIKNKNGFEYRFNIPSRFKNHVNTIIRLRGKDYVSSKKIYSNLNKQILLSLDYPKEFIIFKNINYLIQISVILLALLYVLFAKRFIKHPYKTNIMLSKKLIYVLSIIMFVPIIGIGLLTSIISYNLDKLIDINVGKNLHNSLENYFLLDKEISARRFSSILEMKKQIAKTSMPNLHSNSFIDIFAKRGTKKRDEALKWFSCFNSNIYITNDKEETFSIENYLGTSYDNSKSQRVIAPLLEKYLRNLGLTLNPKDETNELLTLSLLDQYINPKAEIKAVSNESIPSRDMVFFSKYDSSLLFYAKDKDKINYYIYSRLNAKNTRPYLILNNYSIINPLWYQPKYKYTYDTNIAITIYDSSSKYNASLQLLLPNINKSLNNYLYKIIGSSYSNYERVYNKDGTTFNEYIFSENTPFVIAGTTKSIHNNNLFFVVKIIFPFLLAYAIILLILLSNLISSFLNKPIKIYQEGIYNLEKNNFGTTIESFSKDEFNNITNAFNEMSIALKQKEQMKRYVSERLIKSIDKNQIIETVDGKEEKITILLSDIRNFTGISEKYDPSEIVEMLNKYFTIMQQAITVNGGIIDKYIGDAIQAIFYDEAGKENQVIRTARAALAMRKALKDFNEERKTNGLFTIENGIGIDTDYAITGIIGTEKGRKDYSVNGDVISRASELEARTKMTQSKILISKKSIEEITIITSNEEAALKLSLDGENKRLATGCCYASERQDGKRVADGDGISSKHNSMPQQSSQENWIATQSTTAPNDGFDTKQSSAKNTTLTFNLLSLSSKENNCHGNKTVYNTPLVYQDFDNDSVELLDVRK